MDLTMSLKFLLIKSNCWSFSSSNSASYSSNDISSLKPYQHSQSGKILSFLFSIRKYRVNSEVIHLYFHSLHSVNEQLMSTLIDWVKEILFSCSSLNLPLSLKSLYIFFMKLTFWLWTFSECYVMLCYVMLCHVVMCWVVLYFVFLSIWK